MEVTIIRHTKVAVPTGICYGQSDVPLASTFEEEAQRYLEQLPQTFDAYFASSAKRCQALAEKFSTDIITDSRLLEMNFGNWEEKAWNDIPPAELNPWMDDFVQVAPPSGESLEQMFARIAAFLDELKQQSHNKVLIVAHAGVIRCIWAYVTQIPLANIFKIPVGYGEVLKINLDIDHSRTMILQKQ